MSSLPLTQERMRHHWESEKAEKGHTGGQQVDFMECTALTLTKCCPLWFSGVSKGFNTLLSGDLTEEESL